MEKRIRNFKYTKGFTLVELIVVIGIISVMAIAMLAILDPISQFYKANDTKRKADLSQIQKALESYYQDKGRYPRTNGSPNYCMQDTTTSTTYCGGSTWIPYMNIVPRDPNTSRRYVYYTSSDGQSYYLYANLERGAKDPQVCNGGGACTSLSGNGISAAACTGSATLPCNYGVSSPDVTP